MKLSSNFKLGEFTRSAAASRLGIEEQFDPPKNVIDNLTNLCIHVLQPLRSAVASPIRITSGYRCKAVNKEVGGVSNSQHVEGQAADIESTGDTTNAELYRAILHHKLPFDQLVWEYGTDLEPAWVHVSYGPRNRRQVLKVYRKDGKKVTEDITKKL